MNRLDAERFQNSSSSSPGTDFPHPTAEMSQLACPGSNQLARYFAKFPKRFASKLPTHEPFFDGMNQAFVETDWHLPNKPCSIALP